MLSQVKEYINENNLIEDGDRIVLGVSGGADSVCLLHILHELYRESKTKLIVVHVNHGIRGDDAGKDEEFVRDLCMRLDVEYYVYRFNVIGYALEKGLSEEEAGRLLRYQAFYEICQKYGCNKVAIAHNKNDNAETFLFHLFRGSGIKGLKGILNSRSMEIGNSDKKSITIIRPILFAARVEIEAYLSSNHITFRNDLTNQLDDYSRNKIRNQILSYVSKEININAVDHIAAAAKQLEEIERFVEAQITARYSMIVKKEKDFYCFSVQKMKQEDIVIQKGIIFRIIENIAGARKDLESKHVEAVLHLFDKQVGKQVHLPYMITAVREYQKIKLYRTGSEVQEDAYAGAEESINVEVPGRIYLKELNKYLEARIIQYDKEKPIPKNTCIKWFDYDKIENAVVLRKRKEGDYLQINPQGGRKKIKDYFIDIKLPKEERKQKLLIADGSHIMWILGDGERMSEKYKVSKNTNTIIVMNLIDAEEKENDRKAEGHDIRGTGYEKN